MLTTEELLRRGSDPKTTITVKGYGSITVPGCYSSVRSFLGDLDRQEPSAKLLKLLTFFVAAKDPTVKTVKHLCRLLGDYTLNKEQLEDLARFLEKANIQVGYLIQGPTISGSSQRIVLKCVSDLPPEKQLIDALASCVSELPYSRQLMQRIAEFLLSEGCT
ncbi:MAG: hypothetical protein U0840_28655 [Gemmataceae bacterium]